MPAGEPELPSRFAVVQCCVVARPGQPECLAGEVGIAVRDYLEVMPGRLAWPRARPVHPPIPAGDRSSLTLADRAKLRDRLLWHLDGIMRED